MERHRSASPPQPPLPPPSRKEDYRRSGDYNRSRSSRSPPPLPRRRSNSPPPRRGEYEYRGGGVERGGYDYDDRYNDHHHRRYERDDRDDRRRNGPPPPRRSAPVVRGSSVERATTTCLFVGGIPYHWRESDAKDLFSRYGRLRGVTITYDTYTHKNKGFAFVEYEDRRDAEDAKEKYDGFVVDGRKLRLDWDVGLGKKREVRGDKPTPPERSEERRDRYREDGGRERYYEGGRGGVERGGPRDDYRGRFYKDAGHDTEGKKIEVLEENDHQEVVDRRWEKSGRKEC